MRRALSLLGVCAVLMVGSVPVTLAGEAGAGMKQEAEPGGSQEAARTVSGTLLKIDGEFYVVQDPSGKEVRLHVNEDTVQLGGEKQPGDKIRAEATEDGHAISIQ